MSLTGHLEELRRKHQTLSEAVEAAQRAPATDDLEISRLKKQKLHIKEEFPRLSVHWSSVGPFVLRSSGELPFPARPPAPRLPR